MDNLPKNELFQVIKKFVIDSNGKINIHELKTLLEKFGASPEDADVENLMSQLDKDGDGFIDFKDVKPAFLNCGDEILKNAFDFYDKNKDGVITETELHTVLQGFGFKISIENCRKMIKDIDEDGDGVLNFDEFKKLMVKGCGSWGIDICSGKKDT